MKIKQFFLMVVASCHLSAVAPSSVLPLDYEPVAICLGNIVFPKSIDPTLNLYYKGKKLSLDLYNKEKGVKVVPYSLEEKKSCQQFHVLVCLECQPATQENTVDYLYVPDNVSYKFYTLSAARQYGEDGQVEGYIWTITQEILPEGKVPENTIIFLFDADFIDGLDVKSWPQNSSARILPDIVVKKSVDLQELIRAIEIAAISSIDVDTFHDNRTTCVRQIKNQAVISMVS